MAELDPEKVGRSGIDPGTGSPLSQEVRNALLKKSTIDRSVFRNELLESENRKREIDNQNVRVIQSQEQALLGFNSNIQALRTDIGKLGTGLANIALLLQQDNAEELSRARAQQEKERRLAEQQVRIGKENELEQKIQNALVAPVEKLTPKMNDVFGKIGAALGILFGGWLTNEVIKGVRASEENNTKLFNDIKFNILKNLAIVGGGLLAIRAGFSLVKNTIARVAFGLSRLLIVKPLAAASALLTGRGIGSGGDKQKGNNTKRSVGSGILNVASRGLSAVGAVMEYKSGDKADAAVLGASAVLPGKFGMLSSIAYLGDFAVENLFPNFRGGAGFIGADKSKPKTDTRTLKEEKPKESPKPSETVVESAPTPASAPAAVQPQTTMMPPAPSPEMVSQFEQAWKLRNAGWARRGIEDAWSKMTPEQKQQAKAWAESKGYNWAEMRLQDPVVAAPPAQVTPPEKPPTQVGQLPEAQPSITMIKSSNNANQQANVPLTNGALSDVPLINSANPDNFYVLYSQLNYNVVM